MALMFAVHLELHAMWKYAVLHIKSLNNLKELKQKNE
jgi:hypothetical protein